MTSKTAGGQSLPRHRRGPGLEYRAYFVAIFFLSLPGAALRWAWRLAVPRHDRINDGVLTRAWRRANDITPQIFSA
ncbi:MAG: protein pufQ [Rhodobacteraceae bacterium]|nr:protein pufQ [Paracoccaceae bacterium]